MNQTLSLEEQDAPRQELSAFTKYLESLGTSEEKLRASIQFMRDALAQDKTPNFKEFWEARKLCLPFFKEPLPGPLRSQLWTEYIELTREGRRLKNLLDAETQFAVEQIDLAISALEKDVADFYSNMEEVLGNVSDIAFPKNSSSLEVRYSFYQDKQKRLNALNLFASRINSLRKELIRTEMRIRQKNQFFQRLSQLGDQVFPPRKELIREVSEAFIQDVTDFVEEHFSSETFSHEKVRRSVFFFREEIKILQAFAKILTLNTHAFSTTREQLSQCWDKLKGMEKELKKEFAQQKVVSAENAEHVSERIQAFISDYAAGKYSAEAGRNETEAISRWMREIELTRQDVKRLKEELALARQPLEAKQKEEENKRRQKAEAFEQARREKIEALKNQIEILSEKVPNEKIDTLLSELEECRQVFASLSMLKLERQQIERKLHTIRDQIAEQQEQALIDLSDDDRATLENLKSVLDQRKQRRKEIKAQLEEYRKVNGSSGLDFEKAMRIQELMRDEKERLVKSDEGIAEIEKKIRDLKSNIIYHK